MKLVFHGKDNFKNLDYIACWFLKGSFYIKNKNTKLAFVTTNSINQGEQVALLWPEILNYEVEIFFCHTSFKWKNNAKSNAGVTVAVVGVRNHSAEKKIIYSEFNSKETDYINPYLISGKNIIVSKRNIQLASNMPTMTYGNKPVDGGFLILSPEERDQLICDDERSIEFIRPLVGAHEFITGKDRYCLWIENQRLQDAKKIRKIEERINKCAEYRSKSVDLGARELAKKSHQFRDFKISITSSIIIPRHTSENRKYIPFGFLDSNYIISDSAQAIYDPEPYIFGVISSRMHVIWIQTVCGKLKTDYRYSSTLGYNTFPFPDISDTRKQEITQCVFRILEEREKHPEKTLAELYDPDKMPPGLKEAHEANDTVIERCYRSKPFAIDEERLEYLFSEYERMIELEKNRGGLFEVQAPVKKKGRKK